MMPDLREDSEAEDENTEGLVSHEEDTEDTELVLSRARAHRARWRGERERTSEHGRHASLHTTRSVGGASERTRPETARCRTRGLVSSCLRKCRNRRRRPLCHGTTERDAGTAGQSSSGDAGRRHIRFSGDRWTSSPSSTSAEANRRPGEHRRPTGDR